MNPSLIEMPDDRFVVRKYRRSDRPVVRQICCDTGYLGGPVDPVFEDRELFADYLTNYYVHWEPESCFILEKNGQVRGYLLGCRHPRRQKWFDALHNLHLGVTGFWRYFFRPYNPATRTYVKWILTRSAREVPPAPDHLAHFHFNLYPDARKVGTTRALLDAYLLYLDSCGVEGVYGQMVTIGERRGERMFERVGFKVMNKSRVSKFDGVYDEPVYLCTAVKLFKDGVKVYQGRESDRPAPDSPQSP
ncbi:MAG: GNAT family acetyltransferase [Verrucomicrobiae bacterium]|nr:GNAT family acetyltransferase [Verrucomicrobiae bacterium]